MRELQSRARRVPTQVSFYYAAAFYLFCHVSTFPFFESAISLAATILANELLYKFYLNEKKQADEQHVSTNVLQYLTSVSIVSPGDQPKHVVAFASVLRPDMIERCKRFVAKIYDVCATVTIVTMGANAPASLARQIDDRFTVIEWPIETASEPAGWAQKFWRAYGCCELRGELLRTLKTALLQLATRQPPVRSI